MTFPSTPMRRLLLLAPLLALAACAQADVSDSRYSFDAQGTITASADGSSWTLAHEGLATPLVMEDTRCSLAGESMPCGAVEIGVGMQARVLGMQTEEGPVVAKRIELR